MNGSDPAPILHDLLAGRIDAREAASLFRSLSGPAAFGLAHAPDALSDTDAAGLEPLMAAVRWEMAKQDRPGLLPDVAYGSPEYQAFIATVPSGPIVPPEPAG